MLTKSIILALTIFSLHAFADKEEGGGVGNGGGGYICQDGTVRVFDELIQNKKTDYVWNHSGSYDFYTGNIQLSHLKDLKLKTLIGHTLYRVINDEVQIKTTETSQHQKFMASRVFEDIFDSTLIDHNKWLEGDERRTYDELSLFEIPTHCKQVQFAYSSSGNIYKNSRYFNLLNDIQKTIITVHELVYKYAVEHFHKSNALSSMYLVNTLIDFNSSKKTFKEVFRKWANPSFIKRKKDFWGRAIYTFDLNMFESAEGVYQPLITSDKDCKTRLILRMNSIGQASFVSQLNEKQLQTENLKLKDMNCKQDIKSTFPGVGVKLLCRSKLETQKYLIEYSIRPLFSDYINTIKDQRTHCEYQKVDINPKELYSKWIKNLN